MKYIRLTVLLLCALLYSACDSRNPNQTGGAASPVTTEDSQLVTSKIGIAFSVSRLDETIGLYTAELDTRKVHSLTPAGVQDSIPTFSPDGARIAFVRRGEGRPTIFSMRADGLDVQQLGKGDSLQRRPLWSPNGKWIAFLEDETLALLDPTVEKGTSQPLMEFVSRCFSWSTDSKQLLVTAHTKDTSQMSLGRDFGVFLVDASGKQPSKLLGELYPEALDNYGHCPILSPVGTEAIITEPQGYSAEIISIVDETVTRRALPGRCHSFAPDGKRLAAINVSRSIMLIDRTTLEVSELINWQGTSALAVNASPCPAWSPDGKQIAFIRSPESSDYNDELYVVNVADGVQRQISDAEGVVFDFSWSPDGKMLSYKMGGNAKTSGFFVVSVSGGDAFKLTEGLTGLGMMVWTPTKKKLKLNEKAPAQDEAAVSGVISGKITRDSPEFSALVENTNSDIIFKDEEGNGADRMMTISLQERLDVLGQKVQVEWPDNKLRVTEAWDENNEHSGQSLHYEGRAADITVDDLDGKKLGRLGQLAVEAGFDWVWYEDESHVHVSVVQD